MAQSARAQASRHRSHAFQSRRDLRGSNVQGVPNRRRGQSIGDLVSPEQPQPQPQSLARQTQQKAHGGIAFHDNEVYVAASDD